MSTTKFGLPLPQRIKKFKDLQKDTPGNVIMKYDVPTLEGSKLFNVYKVSIDLPKYRLDNTRTLAQQELYIYKHKKNENFFNNVESDQVQEVQHNILKNLISNSDPQKDLIKYFSKTTQTDPLILTFDGFVISGNRRLCAFRELLKKDYRKNKHYAEIRVVILPDWDQDKIEQIEDYLEQQKDIKEQFTWVSRAIGYRRRMQKHKYSDEDLSKISNTPKKDIRGLIDKLEIAERYLEFIKKPKDYELVQEDFYAFNKIYEILLKENEISKKLYFEKLLFIALKNKEEFTDRMYKNIPIIHAAQNIIQKELKTQYKSDVSLSNNKGKLKKLLPKIDSNKESFIPSLKLLNDTKNEKTIVKILTEKVDEYQIINREKKKKISVFEKVKRANTLLHEANTIKNHEATKKGIGSQINDIESEILKLKKWLNTK